MDCTNDRYFYHLLSGPKPLSVIEKDRAWHVAEELDLHAMQEACKILFGRHGFSSFRAAGCQAKSKIRTLDELNVTEVPSTPYFPSIVDRKVDHLNTEDPHVCSNEAEVSLPISSSFDSDKVVGSNGETNFGLGIRRWHRCYVVTARARSFLYHQISGVYTEGLGIGIDPILTRFLPTESSSIRIVPGSLYQQKRGVYRQKTSVSIDPSACSGHRSNSNRCTTFVVDT